MRPMILVRGMAAGAVSVLLWHAAVLSGWFFDGALATVVCAVLAGIAVNLLLRQRGLLRFVLSLCCGLAVGGLGMWLSSALEAVPAMLSLLAPGFFRMTASARYAIMVTSAIFFGILLAALLMALLLRPRGKKAPPAEAEYAHLNERYAHTPED